MSTPNASQPPFAGACRSFLSVLVDHLDAPLEQGPEHLRSCPRCQSVWHAARRQREALAAVPPVTMPEAREGEILDAIYARLASPETAAALRSLTPCTMPMATDAGLADVRARAAAAGEDELGETLRVGVAPLAMPGDAAAGLADVRARALAASEAELGETLREAISPVRAPGDVAWRDEQPSPWVESTLSRMEPNRAPGWMWRRIRGDLERAEPASPGGEPRVLSRVLPLGAAAALLVGLMVFLTSKQGTQSNLDIVWIETTDPAMPALSTQAFMQLGR